MLKGKNLLILALVGGGAYWYWMKMKKDKAQKEASAKKVTTQDESGFTGSYFNASGGCPQGYSYSINSNKVAVCDNGKGHRYRTNKM